MPDSTPVKPAAPKSIDEMSPDELKAELKRIATDKEAKSLREQVRAAQDEADGIKPYVHPPERIDEVARAVFEKAHEVAKKLNAEAYRGHETWHPHGHIVDGKEVCELHTHGSDERMPQVEWSKK